MKKENGVLIYVYEKDLELLEKNPKLFWKGVKVIKNEAFKDRRGLTSIEILDGVKKIGNHAFEDCSSLKSITIPNSVTRIGDGAFQNCSSLESVTISDRVTCVDAWTFWGCSSLKSITIPKSVTGIGRSAFEGCSSLKSIIIPDGVTEIGNYAFYDCSGLESITIPDGVTSIEEGAFEGCRSLESITMSDGVKKIGNHAFQNCSSLKSITIPNSVTRIGDSAFQNCSSLESITISYSVKKIGWYAFSGCARLKEITLGCEDGNHKIKVDDNILKLLERDIGALRDFVATRDRHNKTFLPASQVILNTPKDMVENFYSYFKNWGKLLGEFAKSVGKSPKDILDEPKADFYKLCLISGVFSDEQKEREEAMKFVEDKIIGKFNEGKLHERFTGLETRKNGYNPEYAKFLRLNFDDNFMMKDFGGKVINYFASSYNRFKEVQEAYPNREVVTNTNSDRLTTDIVEKFLQENKYVGVTEETKELAELCGFYGYSQGEFEVVSGWFLQGKQAKRKGKQQLFCSSDKETREDVVTYEFLEKDNPLGAILGDITNCCQKVGDAGESCCRHGMTDPKGGFVVFKKGGKIVGQSWVWYNEEMGKVCLDNVEVPRSAKSSVMHKSAGFIDCLHRLKDGFVEGMSEHKLPVSYVTMGEGYNDILDIARDKFAPVYDKVSAVLASAAIQSASQKVLARGGAPTGVYTDTREGERLIE